MRCTKFLVAIAIAVGSLLAGTNANAQFSVTITIDENGNGTLTNTNGFMGNLASGLQADPGPGGLAAALTYDLFSPPGLTAGDLILVDPGTFTLSDIIRFNPNEISPAGNPGSLVFYSDNDAADNNKSLADTGFPTAFYANNFAVFEVGPEGGPNGYVYTPTAGQPGFVAGAAGPVTYVILSDSVVPEPSSVVLGAIAAVTAAGCVQFRRARNRR